MPEKIHTKKSLAPWLGCPVLIEWDDSAAVSGWGAVCNEPPARIRSVGILISWAEGHVSTAAGISRTGRVHDQLCIPRACIVSMVALSSEPVKQPE